MSKEHQQDIYISSNTPSPSRPVVVDADTCIGCGQCEATCPMNIPLRSIHNWVHRQDPEIIFDSVPGLEPKIKEKLIDSIKKKPIRERRAKI